MVTNRKTFGFLFLVCLAATSALPDSAFAAEQRARDADPRRIAVWHRQERMRRRLAQVGRGSALTILERSQADGQPWVKISMAADQQAQVSREVTGWLPAKAVVTASTANGDEIIFGQAVDSERQAEERGGRKGAAQDALRLYSRVAELFPGSPLAAEAMWRAADIRWQLAKADFVTLRQADGRKISERGDREVSAVETGGAGRV